MSATTRAAVKNCRWCSSPFRGLTNSKYCRIKCRNDFYYANGRSRILARKRRSYQALRNAQLARARDWRRSARGLKWMREYRESPAYRQRARERARERRRLDPESARAAERARRLRYPDKIRARQRARWAANKEELNARARTRRANNNEEYRAREAARYAANRTERTRRELERYAANRNCLTVADLRTIAANAPALLKKAKRDTAKSNNTKPAKYKKGNK